MIQSFEFQAVFDFVVWKQIFFQFGWSNSFTVDDEVQIFAHAIYTLVAPSIAVVRPKIGKLNLKIIRRMRGLGSVDSVEVTPTVWNRLSSRNFVAGLLGLF